MGIVVDPSPFDIVIPRGATFRLSFQWRLDDAPVDLSAATVRAQVRNRYQSATAAAFTASGDAAGHVTANLPASVTAAMLATDGVWDLEVEWPDGDVCRLLMGKAEIIPEVTRP